LGASTVERTRIRELLEEVQRGRLSVSDGAERLARLPVQDLGHTRVDTHRSLRCGFSEVVAIGFAIACAAINVQSRVPPDGAFRLNVN